MSDREPLENHFVQFLKKVCEKQTNKFDDELMIPCIRSIPVNSDDFINPNQIKNIFDVNQILPGQILTFPQNKVGDLVTKTHNLFNQFERQAKDLDKINEEKLKYVSKEIKDFDDQIKNMENLITKINENLQNKEQDVNQLQEINEKRKNLLQKQRELKQKKDEFIRTNLHPAVLTYKQQYEENSQFFTEACNKYKEMLENVDDIIFEKFSYNSQKENVQSFENGSQEKKLAEVLKDLGSINDENKQNQTLENIFDNISIDCDLTTVYFERKWLPYELFKYENIRLSDNLEQQQSNGPQHDQDMKSESPYIIVGAVISKNLKIKGFKNSQIVKEILSQIQNNKQKLKVLIFQAENLQSQQDQDLNQNIEQIEHDCIEIKSPNIIGLILKPIVQSQKIFTLKEDIELPQNEAEPKIKDIEFPYNEAKSRIKDFLNYKQTHEDIIKLLEDYKAISKFPNWKLIIRKLIKQFDRQNQYKIECKQQDEALRTNLPKFKDYDQKKNLKDRFLNSDQYIKDKKYSKKWLNILYQDLPLEYLLKYMDFFEKFRIITN